MTTAISREVEELPAGYWVDPATGAWCSLPWPTDPDERMAIVNSSLGPQIIDWSEGRTDEPGLTDYLTGRPWRWTPGQKRFLLLWYWVNAEGRWVYRSGVKRGAKGTGKDPMAAAWCDIELLGPAHLHDWDDKTGRPIGARHRLPLVQVASNSEMQSKDVLRIANALLGPDARAFYQVDPGETRTILKDGGRLEILTASEKSSEGDPSTAIALNESHHMTQTSGGHRIAEVARRNVGKSPATLQARLLEFTNAHQQGADSVAERSYEAWQKQISGRIPGKRDILYDSIEAPPNLDISDDHQRMVGLRAAYSDAPWSDLERLSDEVMDPRTTLADAIRYYLNGLAAAEDAWIDPGNFDAMARTLEVPDGERIALFLDCSKSGDSTPLIGVTMTGEHVITFDVWRRPHGWGSRPWLVSREEVDARVRQVFARYTPMWFGVDPSPASDGDGQTSYWMPLIDQWHQDFKDRLPNWAQPGAKGHSVLFDMRISQPGGLDRLRQFTAMAEQTAADIDGDENETETARSIRLASPAFTHDGDPDLRSHVHNARRRPNAFGVSLGKVTRDSSKLVDAAVGMVGARLGRRIALNSGNEAKTTTRRRVW